MGRSAKRSPQPAVCLLLFLLATCVSRLSALSVTVNDRECVYEYVIYDGDLVSGNFVVVDHDIFWSSDHPGIDFEVSSPGGNVVYSLKGTSGDKFQFTAPRSGMYQFCFHNPHSTPESVSFYIHVGHIPSEHDLAKDEHLDPINVKIAVLREALDNVTAEQRYLKARDARHRHRNRRTSRRLVCAEAVLLGHQVMQLKPRIAYSCTLLDAKDQRVTLYIYEDFYNMSIYHHRSMGVSLSSTFL